MPQLAAVNPAQASEFYAHQASVRVTVVTGCLSCSPIRQNMARALINTPSPDTLAGLVLLAFFECQAGRTDGTSCAPVSHSSSR
jgi:hypothetical protein